MPGGPRGKKTCCLAAFFLWTLLVSQTGSMAEHLASYQRASRRSHQAVQGVLIELPRAHVAQAFDTGYGHPHRVRALAFSLSGGVALWYSSSFFEGRCRGGRGPAAHDVVAMGKRAAAVATNLRCIKMMFRELGWFRVGLIDDDELSQVGAMETKVRPP